MGKSILRTVIDLLNGGGIPAAPAQPQRHMLNIQTTVAAVSIEKVDTAEGSVKVLVEMAGPMHAGAENCQSRALTACGILRAAGAQCVQGKCSFDGRSALFCVPVTALFYGTADADNWTPRPSDRAVLAGEDLVYLTAFSAEQVKGEEEASLETAPWAFTLEEFYPAGAQELPDPQEPFALVIGKQTFSPCSWTARERICTADGIRQIRKGIAISRTVK